MIKSISLLSIFLILTLFSFSQITNSNVEPDKQKKGKEKSNAVIDEEKVDSVTYTKYYITGSFIHSFRTFEDLSVFQSLGEKYNETPINTYGLGFGTYVPLSDNFDLEIGVSYVLQGEQYSFSDSLTDSTFHYVNKYRHFGLPLRLKYSIGQGDFKGVIIGGVIPSSILSIRYESDYTNVEGSSTVNEVVSTTKNLNSFVLTGSIGVGMTYQKGDIGLIVLPEYRYNFINSYTNYPVSHNLWSWGINFGILMNI